MNKISLFEYITETISLFRKNGTKALRKRATIDIVKGVFTAIAIYVVVTYIYEFTHPSTPGSILDSGVKYNWSFFGIQKQMILSNTFIFLGSLTFSLFCGLFVMYHSICSRKDRDRNGNEYVRDTPAREMSVEDLVEHNKVFTYSRDDFLRGNLPRGQILGIDLDNPQNLVCMPFHDDEGIHKLYPNIKLPSPGNRLSFGKSGGGKSVRTQNDIYQELAFGASLITLDPKGDYNKHLVSWSRYYGKTLWSINLVHPEHSHGIDLMKTIRSSDDPIVSIMRFIEAFCGVKSSGDRNNFFGLSGETMLECFLKLQQMGKGYVNRKTFESMNGKIYPAKRDFNELMEWISAPFETVEALIRQAIATYPEDAALLSDVFQRGFGHTMMSGNNWNSMSGTFKNYDNPFLRELLSTDDVNIDMFLSEQCIINIIIERGSGGAYSRVATVLLSLLEIATRDRDADIERLHPFEGEFDELGNIPRVETLPPLMNLVRSGNAAIHGSFQNFAIFSGTYDAIAPGEGKNEWEHMLDACAYVALLKTDDMRTMKWFSDHAGKKEVIRELPIKNDDGSPQRVKEMLPVFPVERLKKMDDNVMLYMISGEDGIMLGKPKGYEHPYYNIRLRHKETGEMLFAPNVDEWLPPWRNGGKDYYEDYEAVLWDADEVRAEFLKNRTPEEDELFENTFSDFL